MRRDLGHTCPTSLLFPGSGGGPWLTVGAVIARISKLVTREHVVHGLDLGSRPCLLGSTANHVQRRPRCWVQRGESPEGRALVKLAEGRWVGGGWGCVSWSGSPLVEGGCACSDWRQSHHGRYEGGFAKVPREVMVIQPIVRQREMLCRPAAVSNRTVE